MRYQWNWQEKFAFRCDELWRKNPFLLFLRDATLKCDPALQGHRKTSSYFSFFYRKWNTYGTRRAREETEKMKCADARKGVKWVLVPSQRLHGLWSYVSYRRVLYGVMQSCPLFRGGMSNLKLVSACIAEERSRHIFIIFYFPKCAPKSSISIVYEG